MKCDQVHPLIIDFIYEEISDQNKEILQAHLIKCSKCRQQVESLKNTSKILQQWEEVEPDFNLVLVTEKVSWSDSIKEKLRKFLPRSKKLSLGLAYGVVGILLLLALTNTEISYQSGNFKLSFRLFTKEPPPIQNENKATANNQVLEELRQENYYLIKRLIEQSEARQRKEWQTSLVQLNHNFEQRRIQDLNLIGLGLNDIEQNTYKKLQRLDNSLNELFRPVNAQPK